MLQAEIVASEIVDDPTVYTFVADDRIEGTLSTDRPLRVGDDVLVSEGEEPGTWTLAEPLPSAWFGVSIAADGLRVRSDHVGDQAPGVGDTLSATLGAARRAPSARREPG